MIPIAKSPIRDILGKLCLILCFATIGVILYLVISGDFTNPWISTLYGRPKAIKRIRNPMIVLMTLYSLRFVILYGIRDGLSRLGQQVRSFTEKSWAIYGLTGLYAALFVWQQLNAYLSLELHFLPFGYYDYMVHFVEKGKWYYTGCLHGFYHIENLPMLLYPLWALFRSPLFFLTIHGLALSAAALPLYFLAQEKLKDNALALAIAFAYLNFKYVFHGLEMNFTPAGFYPLTIFLVMWGTVSQKKWPFWIGLIVGLFIKEDAPYYFIGLAAYFLIFTPKYRKQGAIILGTSLLVYVFTMQVLGPWSGASSRYDDTVDIYEVNTSTFGETLVYFITHPEHVIKEFFYPWIKSKTLFAFFSKLLFLPLFSFSIITVIAPLGTILLTRQIQWMTLGYHYALHIIPFAFFALVFGASNILSWKKVQPVKALLTWIMVALLALFNAGNYSTMPVTQNDLKTLALVKSIPKDGTLLTFGHLLPYIGYRDENCYMSPTLEVGHKAIFDNAKYVLFAKEVNLFGANEEYVAQKEQAYRSNPLYELTVDDGVRQLYTRKS